MKQKLVVDFSDKAAIDVLRTGGKGSSLAKMFQADIPVPHGYVVTTAALNQFLAENKLHDSIKKDLRRLTIDDASAIRATADSIRAAILGAELSAALTVTITERFNDLSLQLVAVRSSATSEDSETDSWAGELETYLNTTEHTLLDNIKKCWASLFSERAITYRLEKGLQDKDISVAVVIQEMVQSEVSGVCFTVHPVSGQKHILLIEAVWGLGEAIVSGQVTPDSYIYEKRYDVVLRTEVVRQEKMLALGTHKSGIEWHGVPGKSISLQKLKYRQIQSLARICARVEAYYRSPQDIEWALKSGQFFIVQSRPITTL